MKWENIELVAYSPVGNVSVNTNISTIINLNYLNNASNTYVGVEPPTKANFGNYARLSFQPQSAFPNNVLQTVIPGTMPSDKLKVYNTIEIFGRGTALNRG